MIKLVSVAALLLLSSPALAADPDAKPAAPTRGVMRYDANKDGWVDKAEWTAGQEARFKELDANKDGKLSQDELFARTPAAPGNVLPTDRQFERQTAFLQRMDSDKDGFVSKAEFIATSRAGVLVGRRRAWRHSAVLMRPSLSRSQRAKLR